MKNKLTQLAIIILLAITIQSCSKKEIEGTIIDNFGQPLSDVQISITGSAFQGKSDINGNYSIDYAPGNISISYAKDGYITESLNLNISEKVKFPAERIILTKKLNDAGVFFIDKEKKDYFPILRGNITRIKYANEASNMFNIREVPAFISYFYSQGEYFQILKKDTLYEFVINMSNQLVLYKIQDEDGFFYRHEEYGLNSRWSAILPTIKYETKESYLFGITDLECGKYCFVASNKNFNYPEDPIFLFEIVEKSNSENSQLNSNNSSTEKTDTKSKFIGTWSCDNDPIIELKLIEDNKFKIRICYGLEAAGGTEFYGQYKNGKITAIGNEQDFYKYELPTLKIINDNEISYQDGTGITKLSRTKLSMPDVNYSPPVNND